MKKIKLETIDKIAEMPKSLGNEAKIFLDSWMREFQRSLKNHFNSGMYFAPGYAHGEQQTKTFLTLSLGKKLFLVEIAA